MNYTVYSRFMLVPKTQEVESEKIEEDILFKPKRM